MTACAAPPRRAADVLDILVVTTPVELANRLDHFGV